MTKHTEEQIQKALSVVRMSPKTLKAFEKQLRAENASAWFCVASKVLMPPYETRKRLREATLRVGR